MRIIVTGSPRWDGHQPRSRVTELLRAFAEVSDLLNEDLVLVHGDHPEGIDHIVDRWARIHDISQETFPVQRFHYGSAAETVRDRLMIEGGADMVITFVMPEERNSELVDRAKVHGIPVRVIRWSEDWPLPERLADIAPAELVERIDSFLANPEAGAVRTRRRREEAP